MKLHAILNVLRTLAPEHLAEAWDRVGLQVGDPTWPIRRAMLCIDLTSEVLQEAIDERVSLVVAYHPPLFSPLQAVTSLDPKQQLVLEAIRHKIAIYSPHTALDAAEKGVNDWLADILGPGQRRSIRPSDAAEKGQYKLVTFVPHEQVDTLRTALSGAGAGVIGDYTHCSFTVAGHGTFRGGATTNPAVGQRGRLERVAELRVEMVCPAARLSVVLDTLHRCHPYEEPAFDLYRLETPPCDHVGQGRVITLDQPLAVATLLKRIKTELRVDWLDVSVPKGLKQVKRVGLCAGAGGSLLPQAGSVDAFMTGEMRHHDVLAAQQAGVMVVLAGHTQTERPYLKVYRRRIVTALGKAARSVSWVISKSDRPPSRLR